jgi:hypothetical protein
MNCIALQDTVAIFSIYLATQNGVCQQSPEYKKTVDATAGKDEAVGWNEIHSTMHSNTPANRLKGGAG